MTRLYLAASALALMVLLSSRADAAGACQVYYDDTVPVPSGWAAAYDIFNMQNTPLATIDCTCGAAIKVRSARQSG